MRDAYQEQLTALGDALADMCLQTAGAMEYATRALLEADLQLAEQFGLLALPAPVATVQRVVISAIHGAGDIERLGDLALHVAQAARRRHPQLVLPIEVVPYFTEMGKIATALARKAAEVMRSRDVEMAGTLEADDDAMDDLHRHLFSVLMAPSWSHGVGPAVDVTLLGRFYERYADHAVTVARRVVYVVTGRMPGPLAV